MPGPLLRRLGIKALRHEERIERRHVPLGEMKGRVEVGDSRDFLVGKRRELPGADDERRQVGEEGPGEDGGCLFGGGIRGWVLRGAGGE
jgi:hypothetical protein